MDINIKEEDRDERYEYKILVFKITLNGASPAVWRRLNIMSGSTMGELGAWIESVMGFHGCHLHQMHVSHPDHGSAVMVPEQEMAHPEAYGPGMTDESTVPIYKYFTLDNRKGKYIYDFGDNWEHTIELEEILADADANAEDEVEIETCVAGEGFTPPEDCGGIRGYNSLLRIVNDPQHKNHQTIMDWLKNDCCNGEKFLQQLAKGRFDPASVNGFF